MSFPQQAEETPVENPALSCGFAGHPWVIRQCKTDLKPFPNQLSPASASCSQVFHRGFHRPNASAAGTFWGFPQVICALYNKDKGYG